MAFKGNGKATGKGKSGRKGPAPPWMQKGQKELALKGRKLISDSRFVGCIAEWHTSWGWVEPLDAVSHPQMKKNKGRIYVHRSDARGYIKMDAGIKLDFNIYCDARGLGAIDCTEVQAGAVEAAAAVAANSDEVALPEGWEKHWNGEHGEYFYWNRLTKETAWLPPSPASEEEEDDSLPDGWSKHYDAENKQWYYWDKARKRASWERPEEQAEEQAAQKPPVKRELPAKKEPPVKKAKISHEAAATDVPVLAQQRVRGRVVEWQSFFGWILPNEELSEELRPLLEKSGDRVYLNWRDVQPGLDVELDMEVDFMLYEDDNGLAASDVRLPAAKARAVTSKLQGADEDEDAGDAAEAAAALQEGDDEENEGPLLPGWEQMWSDEHECHYYWHAVTKVAAWERPALPFGDDDEEAEEDEAEPEEEEWDGEGTEQGAAHMATPMTPFISQAGRAMTPVTPGAARGNVPTNHTQRTAAGRQASATPARNLQNGQGRGRRRR